MIQIVIPMAGRGSRFVEAGYREPKPFIPIDSKPMIQWVIENLRPKSEYRFIFLCLKEHLESSDAEKVLKSLEPESTIVCIDEVTEGAACTVLLAKDVLKEDDELLLANSDQWVDADIDQFLEEARRAQMDGYIMTMTAEDPKWSYAKLDDLGYVIETAEKRVISSEATVGVYYYRRAKFFIDAAEEMIQKEIRTNNEFYVCPAYNQMIEKGLKVKNVNVGQAMHGLGTPEDLQAFLNWRKSQVG